MLKSEYFIPENETDNEDACSYQVTWISACGLSKSISFSNRYSAQRHAVNMEQDGYRAFVKSIPL